MVELQHVPHVDAHFPQAPPTTHRENLAVGVVGGHCRQVHSLVAWRRPGPSGAGSRGRVDNLRRHQPAMTAPACWHPPNPDLTSRTTRHQKMLISL